jgi:membrane carboxypeptidase/penicillin-binding protein PbpC
MCFTPSLAAGVWVGNSNHAPMKKNADGVVVAAPIVHNFLIEALKGTPVEDFVQPDGIQRITVDAVSGKLPTDFTPQTKEEVFASYSAPKDFDDVHIAVRVDKTTGLAATNLTPPENIELRTFTVFRSERPDNQNWEDAVHGWVQSKGIAEPPIGSIPDKDTTPGDGPLLSIAEPKENATIVQSPFRVSVTTSTANMARVDLLIDGQLVESKTSGPFTFLVSKRMSDGRKTIAVHGVGSDGRATDISIPVTFATTDPLTITAPQQGTKVSGPISLQAISSSNLGTASFYINDAVVGASSSTQNEDGTFGYSFIWDAPSTGTYKVQARTPGGQSQKITFSVTE